ncbi:glycogen-binding subunit 76A [Stomoxys calcitrans]|uniref:CBM21 domain-containing protein n=1 Tax=Stomoxys calcitrans TaxID=35570 RepID=A0A1I8PBZ6_STOCA|nr:glycogen-binding subunit 76A [Stomoxys calcitrans]
MNGPDDLPLQHYSATPDATNCSIISIIPTLGMSSCRGRAEAFARRLSSKLRTLGSQGDESDHSVEDEPIMANGETANTWVTGHEGEQTVTDLQPLRHESDSFFDFDCESPGSPVDECEYLRLIESTSNTPHNSAAESGYACASAASSHSSSDGPYFDVNSESDTSQQQKTHICQTHNHNGDHEGDAEGGDCDEVDFHKIVKVEDHSPLCNGHDSGVFTAPSPPTLSKENSTSPISSESQHICKKPLPSEGPDINVDRHGNLIVLKKENSMTSAIQEGILQELRKQSKDFTVEQEENKKNLQTAETEGVAKENEENLCKVTHTLINGHAENGEEVLQIEVCEIKEPCEEHSESLETQTKVDLETHSGDVKAESPQTEQTVRNSKSQLLNTSHLDTTDDEDDCRPQRVRRCSSLKTGKTPPGTPGRKKIVRFADVLGLDLADIKTFLDEIPTIPKSAYEDLEIADSEPPIQLGPKSDKLLMPLFQQPGALASFLDVVREKLVSLENAAVTDTINHTITGTVRVRNLDFHKSVHIRYTLDGWRSFADLQANYVDNTCDGFSDKFSFVLFGNSLHVGQRLEFAVRFSCKGQQYWDNNYGANYCFQCLPTATATPTAVVPSHHANNLIGVISPTAGEAWCTSFY